MVVVVKRVHCSDLRGKSNIAGFSRSMRDRCEHMSSEGFAEGCFVYNLERLCNREFSAKGWLPCLAQGQESCRHFGAYLRVRCLKLCNRHMTLLIVVISDRMCSCNVISSGHSRVLSR